MTNTTKANMKKLAEALVDMGATKVQVMRLVVHNLRDLGMTDEQINVIGWDFYQEVSAMAS